MNPIVFKEFIKTFQKYAQMVQKPLGKKSTYVSRDSFSLDEHLKLFHSIGEYFYIISDVASFKIVQVGGSFEKMTGYKVEDMMGRGYSAYFKIYSLKEVISVTKGLTRYSDYLYTQPSHKRMHIKFNYTFDLTRKKGPNVQMLASRMPILFNDEFDPIYFLTIYTDISELKTDKEMRQYMIDASDDKDIKKVHFDIPISIDDQQINPFSISEKNILKAIAEGKSSKEIADLFNLSEHTVKTHRKNILKKANVNSSAELIKTAIVNGWL